MNKLNEIRKILNEQRMNGVLIRELKNLSWLLNGDFFVNLAADRGIAELLVTQDKAVIITNNIEYPRIIDEEVDDPTIEYFIYQWYEPERRDKYLEEIFGNDIVTDLDIEAYLRPLRLIIEDEDARDYKHLCRDLAISMKDSMDMVKEGMSEHEIAGILSGELRSKDIQPVVVLVAADDRIKKYRHPIHTKERVNDYVMMSICGRRKGLIACTTRFISFGKPSKDLNELMNKTLKGDCYLQHLTYVGNNAKDIYPKVKNYYASVGYKEEWQKHHQGGGIAYSSREYKISDSVDVRFVNGHALAWNPTITGYKSEDTIFIEEGLAVNLTFNEDLPFTEFDFDGKKYKKNTIMIK